MTDVVPPEVVVVATVAVLIVFRQPLNLVLTREYVTDVVPLVRATYTACLWPLPGFYPRQPNAPLIYRRPEAQDPVERRFFDTVVDDLVATPPRLLFVERGLGQQAMGRREFDFIAYFSASDRFARLLRRYERLGELGEFEVFERVR